MPSPIDENAPSLDFSNSASPSRIKPELNPHTFALALLVCASLQIMENIIPRIPLIPWMRLGLSYCVLLPFLIEFGSIPAIFLLVARNLSAVLYGGQPFSTFMISSLSGITAFLLFGELLRLAFKKGKLGWFGISIALATVFNMSQLLLVKWLWIRHAGFLVLIGPMLAWSILSGAIIAILVRASEEDFSRLFSIKIGKDYGVDQNKLQNSRPSKESVKSEIKNSRFLSTNHWEFFGGLIALTTLFLSNSILFHAIFLGLMILGVRDKGKILISAWPFFFYLGSLHLFQTPGEYWLGDWVTHEGVHQFLIQGMRLASTILLGRWLSQKFPWSLLNRGNSLYLQGFLISLPLLSNMFPSSMQFGKKLFLQVRSGNFRNLLTPAFTAWTERMEESDQNIKTEKS